MTHPRTSRPESPQNWRQSVCRAFTLVELLVVIGIIAVLISILLPVIGKARESGVTVKCMANLRQIHLAMTMYATENKQSLPWGWIWERPAPTGAGASGSFAFTNWAAQLSKYMNVKRPTGTTAGNYTGSLYYETYSQAFRCPSVDPSFGQIVSYSALPTAMPDWYWEIAGWTPNGGGAGYAQPKNLRPAKTTQFYSDNTIIWDSPAWLRAGPQHFNEVPGAGAGPVFSFIDGGLLLYPRLADYRFRDKSFDPYQGIDDHLEQGKPIDIPSKQQYVNTNTDITAPVPQLGQGGVPRFRHNRNKICNAVSADGSVRSFTADFSGSKAGRFYNDPNYVETDWLRRYIMIKYP